MLLSCQHSSEPVIALHEHETCTERIEVAAKGLWRRALRSFSTNSGLFAGPRADKTATPQLSAPSQQKVLN